MNTILRGRLTVVATVFMLAALPLGGFGLRVLGQLEEVHDLNLRALAKASDHVAKLLRNAENVVGSLAQDPTYACELAGRQQILNLVGVDDCEATAEQIGKTLGGAGKGYEVKATTESNEVAYTYGPFTFDVQLNALLAELPVSEEMDLLLIVNGNKEVVADHSRHSSLGLSLASLDGLDGLDGSEETEIDLGGTVDQQVALTGGSYDLLCQPLKLGVDHKVSGWAICGLVDSRDALAQALAVSPVLLIMLFSSVVFGVLLWPILKVLLLSERERFRFVDLYFTMFGTWSALMAALIFVLGTQTHYVLADQTENSNEQLAQSVAKKLGTELKALYGEMSRLDKLELADRTDLHAAGDPQWRPEVKSDFEMIFWIHSATGKQVDKASVWQRNTPKVSLAGREYFRRARDGGLWQVGEDRWFVENVRSVTTTAISTIMSAPSTKCVAANDAGYPLAGSGFVNCAATDARHAVVGIQARLLSVTNPVLSPGVGFAIIDDDGNTIFHSDHRRALKDNLFAEMADGDRLHAAVHSRSSRHFNSSYLGRPHQFYVQPMTINLNVDLPIDKGDVTPTQIPWSVVVFTDNEQKLTVVLEAVGHSMLLTFAFIGSILVLTLIYLALAGQDLPRWFWPAHGITAYHAIWSVGLALTLIVFAFGVELADADTRLALCVVVPTVLITTLLYTSRHATYRRIRAAWPQGWHRRLSATTWYIVASVLLWLNLATIPVYGFYKNALSGALVEFAKQENVARGADLDTRSCALGEAGGSLPADCADDSTCACLRDYACAVVDYRSALFDGPPSRAISTNKIDVSSLWKNLARYKPIYNDTVERRRYLSSDNPEAWQQQDGETLYSNPLRTCAPDIPFASFTPMERPDVMHPVVLLCGLVLLGLGIAWLLYVAKRLYFFDIEPFGPLTAADVLESDNRVAAFVKGDDGDNADGTSPLSLAEIDDRQIDRLDPRLNPMVRQYAAMELDHRSLQRAVPAGVVVKWFPGGRASERHIEPGRDFWRRGLGKSVSDEWIEEEFAPGLRAVEGNLLERLRQEDGSQTKRQIMLRISAFANDYFEALWEQCSDDERLVLVQLVQEAVVNPKQANVVRRLLRRGLIKRDPALRTMSDSFAFWIADRATPEQIEQWEHSAAGVHWSQLRWALVGLLVLAFGFLWFTQRQIVESGLAFLSVAGIAIPSLLRLAASVKIMGGQGDS